MVCVRSSAGRKAAWGGVGTVLKDKSGEAFTLLVTVSLADISVVDHVPVELLNVTATGMESPAVTLPCHVRRFWFL